MMQTISWKLAGGINLVRDAITRNRAPGELIGCMNYESREEGYRRIDGYERFDGRTSPSNILDDDPGEEDAATETRRAAITKVPGDELLAVWRYRNRTYAFTLDDTTIKMFGSSSSGWQEIVLGWRAVFTAGQSGKTITKGDTIGDKVGTVVGHVHSKGSFSGDQNASGTLVFTYDGSTRFSDGDKVLLSRGTWDVGIALPSGATNPQGVAVKANGDLVLVDAGTDKVYTYSGSTWNAGLAVPSGTSAAQGVAVKANGDLVLVDGITDKIYTYSGGSWDAGLAVPSGTRNPRGVSVKANGDLVFVDTATNKIYTYSGSSWDAGIAIPSGTRNPRGVSVKANGDLVLVDSSSDKVYTYSGSSWDAGIAVPSGTGSARGVAVKANGDLVLVDGGTDKVYTLPVVGMVTLETPVEQSIGDGDGTDPKFRFLNQNFFGLGNLSRMYGVTGVGNPFEYDGTMFLELITGVTASTATHIAAHQKHLFIGYPEGGVTYSGTGLPRSFDVNDGAGEFTIGDQLTELLPGYRDTLFVYGRNTTAYLVGTSNADFALKTLSDEAGAMSHTATLLDQPTVYDDRGIRNVTTTEQYGDFSISTISEPIRPLLDFKRDGRILPVAATRVRRKSQYRLFFDDGDCIVLNLVRRGGRLSAEYTRCAYDSFDGDGNVSVGIMRSICSVEDSDGRERIFFVLKDQQYVYEMDSGKSFDGHPIPYYLRLPYNDFRAPHMIKRYRKLLLETSSTFEATFQMAADVDDERELGEPGLEQTVIGPTSLWDESEWSAFYWDVVPIRKAEQRIHGRGRNLSVALSSVPDRIEESHVAAGLTVYYDVRRMQR